MTLKTKLNPNLSQQQIDLCDDRFFEIEKEINRLKKRKNPPTDLIDELFNEKMEILRYLTNY
jgi:hypothetical protein